MVFERMSMKKSLAIPTSATLLITLFVIAVILYFGSQIFVKASITENLLESFGVKGSARHNLFVNAIECSYFRCVEGCKSPRVASITDLGPSPDNPLKTQTCKVDFCKPEYTDTGTEEGRVCGELSQKNPVKIEVSKELRIAKQDFKLKPALGCILSPDASFSAFSWDWTDWLKNTFSIIPLGGLNVRQDWNVLSFDASVYDRTTFVKENCLLGTIVIAKDSISKFDLNEGKYSIFTGIVDYPLIRKDFKTFVEKG